MKFELNLVPWGFRTGWMSSPDSTNVFVARRIGIIWSLDSFPQGWSVRSAEPQMDGSAGQQAIAAVALGGSVSKPARCDSRPGPLPVVFK